MHQAISPFMPFPAVSWWGLTCNADEIVFDKAEHFAKMTARNRYTIAGANGTIQLSIPLVHGRNQRAAMGDILIANDEKWQQQHWRSIVSVYGRTPYFEHYMPELQVLFTKEFTHLTGFNMQAVQWLKKQFRFDFEVGIADEYRKLHAGVDADYRLYKKAFAAGEACDFPSYYQAFADRIGFVANLSALDLLFAEGPHAGAWIKERREALVKYASAQEQM